MLIAIMVSGVMLILACYSQFLELVQSPPLPAMAKSDELMQRFVDHVKQVVLAICDIGPCSR